jgi:sRNA-binding protein
MTYRPNREESEEGVRKLVETYPRCFFEQPELRWPLKKGIIDDLVKDGAPMAPELITASVEWYQTHLGYQLCLLAGRKRVDLHGKEGNAVTEYEHRVAQKKAEAIREKMKRDREATSAAAAVLPPVRFGTALPGFIRSIGESASAMNKPPPTIAPAPRQSSFPS